MRDEYLRESRKLGALSQSLCCAAELFAQTRDREAAAAVVVLAKMAIKQLCVLDNALDTLAEEKNAARSL